MCLASSSRLSFHTPRRPFARVGGALPTGATSCWCSAAQPAPFRRHGAGHCSSGRTPGRLVAPAGRPGAMANCPRLRWVLAGDRAHCTGIHLRCSLQHVSFAGRRSPTVKSEKEEAHMGGARWTSIATLSALVRLSDVFCISSLLSPTWNTIDTP